jgi:hypothetical protein
VRCTGLHQQVYSGCHPQTWGSIPRVPHKVFPEKRGWDHRQVPLGTTLLLSHVFHETIKNSFFVVKVLLSAKRVFASCSFVATWEERIFAGFQSVDEFLLVGRNFQMSSFASGLAMPKNGNGSEHGLHGGGNAGSALGGGERKEKAYPINSPPWKYVVKVEPLKEKRS